MREGGTTGVGGEGTEGGEEGLGVAGGAGEQAGVGGSSSRGVGWGMAGSSSSRCMVLAGSTEGAGEAAGEAVVVRHMEGQVVMVVVAEGVVRQGTVPLLLAALRSSSSSRGSACSPTTFRHQVLLRPRLCTTSSSHSR